MESVDEQNSTTNGTEQTDRHAGMLPVSSLGELGTSGWESFPRVRRPLFPPSRLPVVEGFIHGCRVSRGAESLSLTLVMS